MKYPKLNVEYPDCPFIWHYGDMANIYPIKESRNISYDQMLIFAECCNNTALKKQLTELKDKAEFHAIAQYKQEVFYYNSKRTDEIYVSFHTWLYNKLTGKDTFDTEVNVSLDIECGIYPLVGKIRNVDNYPFVKKFSKDKKKYYKINVGMSINNIICRDCIIHESSGYTRFSPNNQCNILLDKDGDDNFMFVSIITSAKIKKVEKLEKACVTLHIFRNKNDNDPKNIIFEKMIDILN